MLISVRKAPHIQVCVAHLGARRHYAEAVALHRAGILEHFYTDIWAGGLWGRVLRAVAGRLGSYGLQKWAGRYDPGLPDNKVTAFNAFGLEYVWRLRRARTPTERTLTYLWAGERFGSLIVEQGLGDAKAVYAVYGGAKEVFASAKENGTVCLLDQMSCTQLYRRLHREEQQRWPSWEPDVEEDTAAERMAEREMAEQSLADVVLCPSEFVRDYVVSLGVSEGKTAIVPYGIDVTVYSCERVPYRGARPLHVLYVGAVNLMKGIPYLLEALRVLDSEHIQARLVGPILIGEKALAPYRKYCDIVGPVPRSAVKEHYGWADVFVFPSMCEGSAMVTYEALASGLPLITNPNAGSVARDGVDGFIVPTRHADAIAEKLQLLASNRMLLAEMSQNARQRARECSWERYGERLVRAIPQVLTKEAKSV